MGGNQGRGHANRGRRVGISPAAATLMAPNPAWPGDAADDFPRGYSRVIAAVRGTLPERLLREIFNAATEVLRNDVGTRARRILATARTPRRGRDKRPERLTELRGLARYADRYAERVERMAHRSGFLQGHAFAEACRDIASSLVGTIHAVESRQHAAAATSQPQASATTGLNLPAAAKATAVLVQHPDWPATRIAAAVGVSRQHLYRLPMFMTAWRMHRIEQRRQRQHFRSRASEAKSQARGRRGDTEDDATEP